MSQPIVDIGILTIRDDEFRAVLKTFADDHAIYKSRHREYTLRTADAGEGARYRLAILRQIEQGNGEAQEATRDLIERSAALAAPGGRHCRRAAGGRYQLRRYRAFNPRA